MAAADPGYRVSEPAGTLHDLTGELVAAAEARGYARAVAALRDGARFTAWDTAKRRADTPRAWVQPYHRETLARYLEADPAAGTP